MLDTTLDPSITQEMVDEAHSAAPIDYEQVFQEIAARFGQDDPTIDQVRALVAPTIRGPVAACLEARRWHEEGLTLGIGMCLATCRHYFNVDAFWPDAETAGENSAPLHRTTNPSDFPRGSLGYAYNGRHGHIFLAVGGDLCWTTDYRRPGKVDLAPISAMAPWIGGRLIGWGEKLNKVDVWPFDIHGNPIVKPEPKPWTWEDRLAQLQRDLARAKRHDAGDRRVEGLEHWISKVEENHR